MSLKASYRDDGEVAQGARGLGAEGGDLLAQAHDVLGECVHAHSSRAAALRTEQRAANGGQHHQDRDQR